MLPKIAVILGLIFGAPASYAHECSLSLRQYIWYVLLHGQGSKPASVREKELATLKIKKIVPKTQAFEVDRQNITIVELEDSSLAIFKDISNVDLEITTFEFSEFLGLDVVPAIAARIFKGHEGILIDYVPGKTARDISNIPVPSNDINFLDFMLLDYDFGTNGRTGNNYIVTKNGKQKAIDHTFMLPEDEERLRKTIERHDRRFAEHPESFRVSEQVMKNLSNLSFNQLKTKFSARLSEKQLNLIWGQRKKYLEYFLGTPQG